VLSVTTRTGRLITDADDDKVGAHPVVVLSDAAWASAFNRRPDAIGAVIRIGDTRFTFEAQAPTATVFDAPQNNPAYLPTVAAGPSYVSPIQNNPNNPSPAPYPDYNPSPAYPTPNQNAPYSATEAAPSPYTSYQGGQVPPPPVYNAQSPYQQQPPNYPPYGQGPPPALVVPDTLPLSLPGFASACNRAARSVTSLSQVSKNR